MIFHNKVKRTTYDWFCGGRSHFSVVTKTKAGEGSDFQVHGRHLEKSIANITKDDITLQHSDI